MLAELIIMLIITKVFGTNQGDIKWETQLLKLKKERRPLMIINSTYLKYVVG